MGIDVGAERKRQAEAAKNEEIKLQQAAEAKRLAQENIEREQRAAEINKTLKAEQPRDTKSTGYKVDCQACKLEGGMSPAKINRFTGLVLIAGWIIALPACLGIISSIMVWFTGYDQGLQFFWRAGVSLILFCFSCVMGTVGWLLISKRSVFLCKRCGYVMDRTTQ